MNEELECSHLRVQFLCSQQEDTDMRQPCPVPSLSNTPTGEVPTWPCTAGGPFYPAFFNEQFRMGPLPKNKEQAIVRAQLVGRIS